MATIFVSYNPKNQDYVVKPAEKLRAQGFEVWIGNPNDPGDRWWRPTTRAIRDAAAFVVIMTPEGLASELVQLEVSLAVGYEKPIYPLLLAGAVWETFNQIPYEDVRDGALPSAAFYERVGQQAG